ncbi:cytochrome c and c1 heme-lyase [Calocera cornea HHB12733]|uniref:Holocytochrome c-type synthase n=1 Tax=Calocera cornea HHB12733 TaxID=1353952 RepID=A0A165FGI5_9BASI|nr:cytochrome c and c1 heme-lyase [Calocera cornea HHB12733]
MSHASSSTSEQAACPVDHTTRAAWLEQAQQCPIDHDTRSAWLSAHGSHSAPHPHPLPQPSASSSSPAPAQLGTEREVSSIPRADASANWVYPSQSQFYSALARKHAQGAYASPPDAGTMPVVVPIHNAVNERAWGEVLSWERGMGGESCGGVKLHSFVGKPRERTWRAWGRVLMGCGMRFSFFRPSVRAFPSRRKRKKSSSNPTYRYHPPFDRHDWIVDRCGHRIRYIIDFYAGRPPTTTTSPTSSGPSSPAPGEKQVHPTKAPSQVSFYLDVRPAPDSWEGVRMRLGRAWEELWGR